MGIASGYVRSTTGAVEGPQAIEVHHTGIRRNLRVSTAQGHSSLVELNLDQRPRRADRSRQAFAHFAITFHVTTLGDDGVSGQVFDPARSSKSLKRASNSIPRVGRRSSIEGDIRHAKLDGLLHVVLVDHKANGPSPSCKPSQHHCRAPKNQSSSQLTTQRG